MITSLINLGSRVVAPERATRRQLQGFHSQEYINFLETHSDQSDSEDEETAEEMGLGTILCSSIQVPPLSLPRLRLPSVYRLL